MNALLPVLLLSPLQDPLLLDLAWERTGARPGERFGTALAAGDVDGDGFEDLLVGSPGPGGMGSYPGRVELYLGSDAGLATTPAWVRDGGWPGARFGAALATADVNGDGFADIVVAAPDFDVPSRRPHARADLGPNPGPGGPAGPGSSDEGAVSLFLGNAHGQPTLRRVIVGLDSGEHLGSAVANAGDVNGDGFDDVLMGASGKNGNRGLVLLFHGSPSGLPSLPAWWLPGVRADAGFGTLLAGIGDHNGDGFGDFALAHDEYQNLPRVASYLGGPSGPVQSWAPSSGEDAVALAALELGDAAEPDDFAWTRASIGAPWGARIRSNNQLLLPSHVAVSERIGAALVGADMDGDGFDDLAVGAPGFVGEPGLEGRVYLYRRGAERQDTVPLAMLDGDQPGAGYGEVLAALDADGDGCDELVIAAPRWDGSGGGEGLVRVHRGDAGPFTSTPYQLPAGFNLYSMSGDFDGDGFDDLFGRVSSGFYHVVRGSSAGPEATTDGYTAIPQGQSPRVVDVGDLNADGFDDLVLSTGSCGFFCGDPPDRIGVFLGGSAGLASTPVWQLAQHGSRGYSVGDVDGDGYGEFLVTHGGMDELYAGTVAGPGSVPMQLLDLNGSLSFGDVDGDGLADVVVLDVQLFQAVVYRGTPAGLAATSWGVQLSTFAHPLPARLADVNGDGFDDLLAESYTDLGGSALDTYLGSPAGFVAGQGIELDAEGSFVTGVASDSGARLDVNGDGREDVVVSASGNAAGFPQVQRQLRIHLGSPAGLRSLAVWGTEGMEAFFGDTDGDGRLELACADFMAGGIRFRELP
jgi:hypothetical protein